MNLPESKFIVGYADDAAVVVVARSVNISQMRLNQVMWRTISWIVQRSLELATHKTGIVLLTKKRIDTLRYLTDGVVEAQARKS